MSSSQKPKPFATQLLQQDEPLQDSKYREYRMNLANALTIAERREKLSGRVAWMAFLVAVVLMFVGGSKVVGSFDPWDQHATIGSIALAVIYGIACVAWPLALAVGFARYRPKVREIQDQIRDTSILALQCEIAELRQQVSELSRRDHSA